jgi:hypothetical protein
MAVDGLASGVLAFANAASGPLGDSLRQLVDALQAQAHKIRCAGRSVSGLMSNLGR